jgi:formamidopyrimidine-DNA glycosylase
MPELPEITVLARQMNKALAGKTIADMAILQPKCLNVEEDVFRQALTGAQIREVSHHGKWLFVETTQGWLLLCLGMGGEILLVHKDSLPEKHRLVFDFDDGTRLAINFWWFGYAHYAADLADHAMTATLGPDALDLTLDEFHALLDGRRGGIKSFLLNQSRIAGIGNVYVQDPLFVAGIHPARAIPSLTTEEIAGLWRAIRGTLQQSIDQGGSAWEMDLYGKHGGWDQRFMRILHLEGQPCPVCGTTIENVKTGSTRTRVCPACQPV